MSHEQQVSLRVNGNAHLVKVRSAETLLETIRTRLRLTGAKPGCENGDCGSCTVLINNTPYKSCIMLTVEAEGRQVTTVEGLHRAPIQEAFMKHFAYQCGYCTPGFLMNAHALITSVKHEPGTELAQPGGLDTYIQEWLESNICRCTSYEEIGQAVKEVLMDVTQGGRGASRTDRQS